MRTNTGTRTSFTRPGSVTYDLPSPSTFDQVVTITLPPGSDWTSGLHWHESHTEYLQILSGCALITLSNITKTYTSASGPLTIPRFTKHEWRRASPSGEPLVVREWTEPMDRQKGLFFRNLNSSILDSLPSPPSPSSPSSPLSPHLLTLQIHLISSHFDNYPVLFSASSLPFLGNILSILGLCTFFERVITKVVFVGVRIIGWWMGLKGSYEEYVPQRPLCSVHEVDELEGELERGQDRDGFLGREVGI